MLAIRCLLQSSAARFAILCAVAWSLVLLSAGCSFESSIGDIACDSETQCAGGSVCLDGYCRPQAEDVTSHIEDGASDVVDIESDDIGDVTGIECTGDQVVCGDRCVDLASDEVNCGGCGQVCVTSENHAQAICNGGVCDSECEAGFMRCHAGGGCVAVGGGACNSGDFCNAAEDCASGLCEDNECQSSPACNDSIKNGEETDVDCGGSQCDPCGVGETCDVESDCQPAEFGDWDTCSFPVDVCAEAGEQHRSVTRYACGADQKCEEVVSQETQACTRQTAGVSCGATVEGAWSACENPSDICALTGTQSRIVTTSVCSGGACASSDTVEQRSCTRETDGIECAAPSSGAWGECIAFDACTYSGMKHRMNRTSACAAGVCEHTDTGESQPCTRETDGDACTSAPGCDAPTACVASSSGSCSGTQSKTCYIEICADQSCGVPEVQNNIPCVMPQGEACVCPGNGSSGDDPGVCDDEGDCDCS